MKNKTEPQRHTLRWIPDQVWALAMYGKYVRGIRLGKWLTEAIREKAKRESGKKG